MKKPVILLAFADYRTQESHLRELGREQQSIKNVLELAVENELCEFDIIADATVPEIIRRVEKYGDRLVGFHFAGHADGYRLLLRDTQGKKGEAAYAEGLAPLFSTFSPNLQFVFLNGCSTQDQAQYFLSNNIPLVIATSEAIQDQIARNLAVHFYTRLAQGASIQSAFQSYKFLHSIKKTPIEELYNRGIGSVIPKAYKNRFPWELYPIKGAEKTKKWSLPQATGNCLFFLPALPDSIEYPHSPFKHIQSYTKEDARIFFGRSCLIQELYHKIKGPENLNAPLLLVYGQSGVGKTSFLKAGLFPRLENEYRIKSLKRDPSNSLLTVLLQFLEIDNLKAVKEAWLKKEETEGRPFCLVIDQLEEVFTNPLKNVANELAIFIQAINQLLIGKSSIRSKIIFSFREEYLADVEDSIQQNTSLLPHKFYVKRLSKAEMIEVMQGPLVHYNLTYEEGLPARIAHVLSEDQTSAIGPILQVLLSKLWTKNQQTIEGRSRPVFTTTQFYDLKKGGHLLQTFFHEKVAEIQKEQQGLVEAGLIHDILNFHTTAFGSSKIRQLEDIHIRYAHHDPHLITQLLESLVNKHLLNWTDQGQDKFSGKALSEHKAYRLSHDILAPIIRYAFQESDRPGQKAGRLIRSKLIHSKEELQFNAEELDLVQAGIKGMPNLKQNQKDAIDRCTIRIRKEKRKRKIFLLLASIGILTLFTLSGFYWHLNRQQISNEAVRQGLSFARHDPTIALPYFYQGLLTDQNNLLKKDQIAEAIEDQLFYTVSALGLDKSEIAQRIAISPTGDLLLATLQEDHENDLLLIKKSAAGRFQKYRTLKGPSAKMYDMVFSKNEEYIAAGGADHSLHLWKTTDESFYQNFKLYKDSSSSLMTIAISADQKWLTAADNQNKFSVWQINQADRVPLISKSASTWGKINKVVFHPNNTYILLATSTGSWLFDLENQVSKLISSDPADWAAFSAQGELLVTTLGKNAFIGQFSPDSLLQRQVISHPTTVSSAHFTPDGKMLYTAAEKVGYFWDLASPQSPIFTSKGHQHSIKTITFAKDTQQIISYGTDNELLTWEVPYPYLIGSDTLNKKKFHIKHILLSEDGRKLISATDAGIEVQDWYRGNARPSKNSTPYPGFKYPQIQALGISQNNFVISADRFSNQVHIWGVDDQDSLAQWSLSEDYTFTDAAISSDGKSALICTNKTDSSALIWDWKADKTQVLIGNQQRLTLGVIHADGQYAIAAEEGGQVLLWELSSGLLIDSFPHPEELIIGLSFMPHEKAFCVATASGKVLRWDVPKQQLVPTVIVDINSQVKRLKWTDSGQYFLQQLSNGTLQLRDQEGYLLQQFLGTEDVIDFTYLAEEQLIIGGCKGGIIKYWQHLRPNVESFLANKMKLQQ